MTETEKNNCLSSRYAFDRNRPFGMTQDKWHDSWVNFVEMSNLSENEKRICIEEFIPNEETAKQRYK